MRQHTNRGALLASNLPQLQNLIKRDPDAYKDEFLQQWTHYNSIRAIFALKPDENSIQQEFRELTAFLSQVSSCYPKETVDFHSHISTMLLTNYTVLSPDLRKNMVQALVTLRNKNVITSITLLQTLFPLLPRTTSPALRTFIRKTILTDIKTANLKAKNHKLNRSVQTMLFAMVERGMEAEVVGDKGKVRAGPMGEASRQHGGEAMWAIILAKELWKKGVWSDAKTVAILALGSQHPVTKVQSASIHFFLGSEDDNEEESDSEEEVSVKGLLHRREINKKTRSGDKKLTKIVKNAKKKRAQNANKESTPNFPALQLLHDPQTFGEKLYDGLNRYDKRFSLEHKVLIMRLLSRVMGSHDLCVLSFYSYIIKYLTRHQLQITSILVSLAQSVHALTPPDVLTPCIQKIANEFIHPGASSEGIAAGLNSVREICRRQPWCMEADLLGDLIEYKKSKDKGVMVAARSLLALYRDVNPGLLKKRDRGKEATMNSKLHTPLPFGHLPDAHANVEGLELLEEHLEREREARAENEESDDEDDEDEDAGWEGWDAEPDSSEEDSSSDDGWNDVSSDEGGAAGFDVSDSEDDKEAPKGIAEEKDDSLQVTAATPSENPEAVTRVSTLATTKILTPADFALLNELRHKAATEAVDAGGGKSAKRKLVELESFKKANEDNKFLSEAEILGPRKKAKADYEERMASIQKGREGREKFGSKRGKDSKENPSSSTNREKARKKPFMMVMASSAVRSKKKASLREKQKKLRAHSKQGGKKRR